jgi:hypothetical protein
MSKTPEQIADFVVNSAMGTCNPYAGPNFIICKMLLAEAITQERQRADELVKALEFYAERKHFDVRYLGLGKSEYEFVESGDAARAALAKYRGEG